MNHDSELSQNAPPAVDWLVGGGKMGEVVRATDWSASPLGSISNWSPSLRTTVSLALNSNFPISLIWGPEHTQIYNDGYWPLCGGKHPVAMGQDFSVCWASAWPVIGEAFRSASAGTAAFLEDQRMFLDRLGYLEETFFTFSFSPIRDESGAVAGLFHPVTETSSKMIGQRRVAALRDLNSIMLEARTMEDGLHLVAQMLGRYDLDVPFALFYRLDADQRVATLGGSTGVAPGTPAAPVEVDLTAPESIRWPLAEALRTGSAILVGDLPARFPGLICGPYPESVSAAFIQPITPPGHRRPACVMISGVSSRLPLDEAYRSFYEMIAAAVTTVLASADAHHAERRRAEALAETDRARTTFFNNVSREFRTPLTLLLAPIEDELQALAPGSSGIRRERLELAHRNALRLLGLVNTLLDFAHIKDDRLQAGFEATDLAALTIDLAGSFRSACERAEHNARVAASEARLRLITDALPVLVERALAGESGTIEVLVPDDGRMLHCSYIPDVDPEGQARGYFGLVRDETQSHRAAAEIRRLTDELEQRVIDRTAELAAVNDELQAFSYSVSHDLRAPLRAVDGFARLLQEQPSGAEAERYLTLIRKNARTMASLIDGLLKLSQLGRNSLQRQRLDVEALVRQCVDDLLTQRPDQRIEVDLGDLHQCEADDVLFRQIWTNLLSNAAKYSQPRPITRISIGSTRQGDEITYFCRDNGVGFEMRYAEKLFKVFQRLHREEDFEGSGIGLSTVQRIVQRHGGRVWAEAEPDRGATFFFALPARAVRPPVADRSP